MPYITQDRRADLDPLCFVAETAGELNFQLTTLVVEYVQAQGLSYQAINDVLGALTGARDEFYRRVAVPYEDTKILANGDVYRDLVPAKESTPQTGALDARTSPEEEVSAGYSRRAGCGEGCWCRTLEGRQ